MNRSAAASRPAPAPQSAAKRQFRVCAPTRRDTRDGEKTFWPRIGVAFENEPKDGKPASISIKLDALPLGAELVLFVDDGEDGRTAGEGG